MITNYDTESATFILPINCDNDFEYADFERLNMRLGPVYLEVDYGTKNFTKFDVDYSLADHNNLDNAKSDLDAVYEYVKKYFGITTETNAEQWQAESSAYLEQKRQENIKFYTEWLQEIIDGGIEKYKSVEAYDAAVERMKQRIVEETA